MKLAYGTQVGYSFDIVGHLNVQSAFNAGSGYELHNQLVSVRVVCRKEVCVCVCWAMIMKSTKAHRQYVLPSYRSSS